MCVAITRDRSRHAAALLLAVAACALVSACSTLPPSAAAADLGLTSAWPQRRALLQQLRSYECAGRVAVSAPGQGFNATLVDPQTADVVVRALATHRRSRVLSSPKILVDDNAEGTLESVNEVPFTSEIGRAHV